MRKTYLGQYFSPLDLRLNDFYMKECYTGKYDPLFTDYQKLLNYLDDKNSEQTSLCTGPRELLSEVIRKLTLFKTTIPCFGSLYLLVTKGGQVMDNTNSVEQSISTDFTRQMYKGVKQKVSDMRGLIDHCVNDQILIYLELLVESEKSSHANILYIDKKEKTVERFEPNGSIHRFDGNNQINNYLSQLSTFKGFRFIPTLEFCPYVGPQRKQAKQLCVGGGLCMVYATLYAHLRIIAPQLSRSQIVDAISSGSGSDVLARMLRYLYFVGRTVPHHKSESVVAEQRAHDQLAIYDPCELRRQFWKLADALKEFDSLRLLPGMSELEENRIKQQIADDDYFEYYSKHPSQVSGTPIQSKIAVIQAFTLPDLSDLVRYPISYKYLSSFFTKGEIERSLFESGLPSAYQELIRMNSDLASPSRRQEFMATAIDIGDPIDIYAIIKLFKYDPDGARRGYEYLFNHHLDPHTQDLIRSLPDIIKQYPQYLPKIKQIIQSQKRNTKEIQISTVLELLGQYDSVYLAFID